MSSPNPDYAVWEKSGLQPLRDQGMGIWGVAPSWYGATPLALKSCAVGVQWAKVIVAEQPTIVGIVMGMALAMVGYKGPIVQRGAGDLGRLVQKDYPGGNIQSPANWVWTPYPPESATDSDR